MDLLMSDLVHTDLGTHIKPGKRKHFFKTIRLPLESILFPASLMEQ